MHDCRCSHIRVALLLGIFFWAAIPGESVPAQSMARLTLDSWHERDLAETFDHPMIQAGGHVNGAPSDTQVVAWDSFGRVRLSRDNADSPFVGYRILTIDLGTDSRYVRSTMDEFDLGFGLQLGEIAGWKVGTVLGAGYSSTHPFVHTSGIFGIGHLTAERKISDDTLLALSIDYEGNGGLLPDIPLPGFAFIRNSEALDYSLGFPMSKVVWRPTAPWEITATYGMPFSADIDVEYRFAKHFGLYADAGNFFQGFVTAHNNGGPDGDITNRQFYQSKRVEAGVRIIFDPLIDAAIGVGYAFDQTISRGFDVRDLQGIAQLSNEPYVAIILRGRF